MSNSATDQARIGAILRSFDNDPDTKAKVMELFRLTIKATLRNELKAPPVDPQGDLEAQTMKTLTALTAVLKLATMEAHQ